MVVKHTSQDGIYHLESLIYLFPNLGASEHDLTADEDEQYDLRLHHTIDQAREQLWFIRAEVVMSAGQAFQTDRELDVA